MKILVFSDTHLTDRFDQGKFRFLQKIINFSDQVIINGDFWDSWFTNFDDFVNSEWRKLFPILLKKRAIYIYGNHDPARKRDSRASLFSVEQEEFYILTLADQTYRRVCPLFNH